MLGRDPGNYAAGVEVKPAGPTVDVVVCTRDRPAQLQRTLRALRAESDNEVAITIVEQSEPPDSTLEAVAAQDPRITLVRDRGRGAARARNLGWRSTAADWVLFVDDDCVPQPGWLSELEAAVKRRPEAALITGHVAETPVSGAEDLALAAFPVHDEQLRSGRWIDPCAVGYTVFMAIQRRVLDQLGGFDERLGTGSTHFPAGEDPDFNYRLLKAGGIAYLTPKLRALHDQRRTGEDLRRMFRGRAVGWAGFALKHTLSGDPLGGTLLWWRGVRDVVRMLGSGIRRRSWLRLALGLQMARGLVEGTYLGLKTKWRA